MQSPIKKTRTFDADTIYLAIEPLKLYLETLEEIDDNISIVGIALLNGAVAQMEDALTAQASYPLS
jgi:uncharacterized protein YuzE